MSRHAHDDFSFLPTVDSTEEEGVENEGQDPPQPEWTEPVHEEVTEQVFAEEPVHEEEAAVPPEEPVFVQEPQPASLARGAETDAAHSAPEEEPELTEVEDVALPIPRAPQAVRKSVVPEVRPSTEPAASVPTRGEVEPKAVDRKPFIAPKPPPEEPLDPEQAKKLRWQKLVDKVGLRTLGMSFGVHLFLLLIAAFVGVSQVMEQQVDFLPGGSSSQSQAAAEALTHKIQQKKNPWLKAKPQMRKITVETLSTNIVLPEMPAMESMDFSQINNRMDLSKAHSMGSSQPMGLGGAGGGFGAGIGTGGKFTFLGQTAIGRRVVFVIDVSASMREQLQGVKMERFDLLKKELIKAVSQIPFGTAYQVLYFNDFAWPHNQVDSRNGEALGAYRWTITPEDYKEAIVPAFKYIAANPFSLQESVNIIQNSEYSGATNWGSGLLMALKANPKPDVIFFMTDGSRYDENGWIDIVTAENKRKLPMTVIHTSVMAVSDAAREMDSMAKRNNGTFTVITDEGKIVKGQDFFKMK
ncbi:MAG: hypothetical protein B7Z37_10565 [Verrucomicrobia bacterium 12-59-8]|nr:MAG: hypothetical protein B7Z37_10565 [Verrucomicrobia bacterium 12-59-8]